MQPENTKTSTPFKYAGKILIEKKLFLAMLLPIIAIASFSCKKVIEQQQKNIIVNAITTGHWYVELYTDTTANVTGDFAGYEFQFYENGNVDGIKAAVTQSTGTWSTDIPSYTITAAFPATANDTLKRLNYTWKITDSYLDYVEAKTTTGSGDNILHLRKK